MKTIDRIIEATITEIAKDENILKELVTWYQIAARLADKFTVFEKRIIEANILKCGELSLEKYPVKMITIGDNPEEWDENEQYRECWIEGYMYFLNETTE